MITKQGCFMRIFVCSCLLLVAFSAPAKSQITPFNIDLNYTGPAQFQAAFTAAEAAWETIIQGWDDGVNIVSDNGGNSFYNLGDNLSTMFINANVVNIDGQGGILGSAGPSEIVNDGTYWLASHGNMNFDTADIANLNNNGTLEDVILHEMGHVLGIGTLWTTNNLYSGSGGQYFGANALREYQREFNNGATFVPVEQQGGTGTANGHWDESTGSALDPDGLVVIDPASQHLGRTRSEALMTGFLDTNDPFISATTGGSLQDLGYTVDIDLIRGVPEPGSVAFILIAGILGLSRRRRVA